VPGRMVGGNLEAKWPTLWGMDRDTQVPAKRSRYRRPRRTSAAGSPPVYSVAVALRKFLTGLAFVILMVWVPSATLALLIAVPVITWYTLGWIWGLWKPEPAKRRGFRASLPP
jgi:hypothetical protein